MINFSFARKEDPAVTILKGEVVYLQELNQKLLDVISNLTEKPTLKSSTPEEMRPKKFDPLTGSYVPKTDAEIESDRKAFSELGII